MKIDYDEKLKNIFSDGDIRLIKNMHSGDVTFDMLTDGQKDAFIEIAKYIDFNENKIIGGSSNIPTRERHISLTGFAGSGKSTLMKFVIDYISFRGIGNDRVICCAPTHGAKKVLSNFVKRDVYTIHKMLKIVPIRGIKNLTFGKRNTKKENGEGGELSNANYIICDESSFYDEFLFEALLAEVKPECLIIFVGDSQQLFGTSNKISPVFSDGRFKQLQLTEIKRTDSPIIAVGSAIREGLIQKIDDTWVDDNGNGVIRHFSDKSFMDAYYKTINGNPENFHENRIVSYYNANVNRYNFGVRQRVYDTRFQFIVGEYIVAQEPYIILKDGEPEVLFENGTLLKIIDASFHEDIVTTPLTPEIFRAKFYRLRVINEDCPTKSEYTVDVLTDSLVKSYDEFVERTFNKRIGEVKRHRLDEDDSISYMVLRDARFLSVKHLPSCTIHKSQGTTVDNIFVDASHHYSWQFKNGARSDLRVRLDYVAITRARKQVHIKY